MSTCVGGPMCLKRLLFAVWHNSPCWLKFLKRCQLILQDKFVICISRDHQSEWRHMLVSTYCRSFYLPFGLVLKWWWPSRMCLIPRRSRMVFGRFLWLYTGLQLRANTKNKSWIYSVNSRRFWKIFLQGVLGLPLDWLRLALSITRCVYNAGKGCDFPHITNKKETKRLQFWISQKEEWQAVRSLTRNCLRLKTLFVCGEFCGENAIWGQTFPCPLNIYMERLLPFHLLTSMIEL